MKVGLVTDFYYPWIGGPAILVRALAHGLAARGHEVSILAPSPDGPSRVESEERVRVTRAATVASPTGYNLRVAARPLKSARAWLREEHPDVVHVHHPFPLSAAAVLLGCRAGVPVAATNHTIPECSLWGIRGAPALYPAASFLFGKWITFLLSRCASVATPTQTAAAYLRALGWTREIEVISNGIDTERFRPARGNPDLKTRLGLGGRHIVLYTGRLDAEKDMETWLRAIALLPRDLPVQAVIGGEGADRRRLEALSRQLDLSDRVAFIGYVSDSDLPDLYRLADVYFITSAVELQSISTLEAVTSGLPVVAARAAALPELVSDGLNGRLVPPHDPRAAAAALTDILSDTAFRAQAGCESRTIGERHAFQLTIDQYERFLLHTAEARATSAARERVSASGR